MPVACSISSSVACSVADLANAKVTSVEEGKQWRVAAGSRVFAVKKSNEKGELQVSELITERNEPMFKIEHVRIEDEASDSF